MMIRKLVWASYGSRRGLGFGISVLIGRSRKDGWGVVYSKDVHIIYRSVI